MQNLTKTLNIKHLAIFIPLTATGFILGGITPTFIAAVTIGAGYIAWQVTSTE